VESLSIKLKTQPIWRREPSLLQTIRCHGLRSIMFANDCRILWEYLFTAQNTHTIAHSPRGGFYFGDEYFDKLIDCLCRLSFEMMHSASGTFQSSFTQYSKGHPVPSHRRSSCPEFSGSGSQQ